MYVEISLHLHENDLKFHRDELWCIFLMIIEINFQKEKSSLGWYRCFSKHVGIIFSLRAGFSPATTSANLSVLVGKNSLTRKSKVMFF